jgi:hypothetical protein
LHDLEARVLGQLGQVALKGRQQLGPDWLLADGKHR